MPAFQKGHKKVGGRKPGSHNKSTLIEIEAARAAAEMNMLPVDYMLSVMRDETAEPQRRDAMAIACAPYCHARIAVVDAKVAVEHSEPALTSGQCRGSRAGVRRFTQCG